MPDNSYVIVGLGNPEPDFAMTRHNAGFMVVASIADKVGLPFKFAKDFQAEVARGPWKDCTLILARPLTYMNLSGRSVQRILHWFKISHERLLIVHDDVSLPLGKIRIQKAGSAGGQHGVESVIEQIATADFDRIKVGVGPDPGGERRADFVLSRFPETELALLEKVVSQSRNASLDWIKQGTEWTRNKYNGLDLVPKPPKPAKPPKPSIVSPLSPPDSCGKLPEELPPPPESKVDQEPGLDQDKTS